MVITLCGGKRADSETPHYLPCFSPQRNATHSGKTFTKVCDLDRAIKTRRRHDLHIRGGNFTVMNNSVDRTEEQLTGMQVSAKNIEQVLVPGSIQDKDYCIEVNNITGVVFLVDARVC